MQYAVGGLGREIGTGADRDGDGAKFGDIADPHFGGAGGDVEGEVGGDQLGGIAEVMTGRRQCGMKLPFTTEGRCFQGWA